MGMEEGFRGKDIRVKRERARINDGAKESVCSWPDDGSNLLIDVSFHGFTKWERNERESWCHEKGSHVTKLKVRRRERREKTLCALLTHFFFAPFLYMYTVCNMIHSMNSSTLIVLSPFASILSLWWRKWCWLLLMFKSRAVIPIQGYIQLWETFSYGNNFPFPLHSFCENY